jgi:di/tripeptidase
MLVPRLSDAEIGARAFGYLQAVVAIDSQSDEASPSVPTTDGQRVLADWLGGFFEKLGATVERDAFANVLARFPGRGTRADRPPLAMLIHLDTARGTLAAPSLNVKEAWDGTPIPYPKNPSLQVDLETYPAAAEFKGHDVVFGAGEAPFGLDDKLGLTHMMTLASLLAEHPDVGHPPLILVGRPDEEVGREEAIVALAARFAELGVKEAYTIDGILPYEINVENFNAAVAHIFFPDTPVEAEGTLLTGRIGGVNTHGATAAAEGHRNALRLFGEWMATGVATPTAFQSDALRDCDATFAVRVADVDAAKHALEDVMAPHLRRGASFYVHGEQEGPESGAVATMMRWVEGFYASAPGFTLPAEASSGRDGYTQPYRARRVDGGVQLDLRLRDFDEAGLDARIAHARSLAPDAVVHHQYTNMGPRLAAHPGLLARAKTAAASLGIIPRVTPIRGGTGVDPFLDQGIPVANLGTGYFSPESEKELTSLQMMAKHARWLFALVQV